MNERGDRGPKVVGQRERTMPPDTSGKSILASSRVGHCSQAPHLRSKEDSLFARPFVALLTVQLLMLLGSAVLCFACPLFLLDRTGSAATFGLVSAAAYVPYLLLAPIGGALADRTDRRAAIATLAVLLALSTLAFLLLHDTVDPVIIVGVMLCLIYGVQAMLRPIVQTVAADIAGSECLERAIAVVSQVTMGSNILGPVLGAAAYGFWGIRAVCSMALAGFAAATAATVLLVRIPAPAAAHAGDTPTSPTSLVRDYAQATDYLAHAPRLCLVIALAAIYNLVLTGATIGTPIIVTQHFKLSSTWVGTIEAGMGVDGEAMCRALVLGLTWLMTWDSIASIEIVSHVQQAVSKDICGKVLALMYMVLGCATPVGQLVYGAAYDIATPAVVYAGMALALAVLTVAFLAICGGAGGRRQR